MMCGFFFDEDRNQITISYCDQYSKLEHLLDVNKILNNIVD